MTTCADCAKMDLNDVNKYGECYCGERNRYYPGGDSICSYFVKRKDVDCYLTTVVVECLGYGDYSSYLQTLRSFRDNVMKGNKQYEPLLIEYDAVGPVIAMSIHSDAERLELSKQLMEQYIKPVCGLLGTKNYDEAVSLYKDMVFYLKDRYKLE